MSTGLPSRWWAFFARSCGVATAHQGRFATPTIVLEATVLLIGDYLEFTILEVAGLGELRPSAFLSSFDVYGPTVAAENLLYSGLVDADWVEVDPANGHEIYLLTLDL